MTEERPSWLDSIYDVEFPGYGGESIALDIHRPRDARQAGVVLYWHGGGWATGSRRDFRDMRLFPLVEQGYVVVSAEYRPTTTHTYPTQFGDARGALAWVQAQIATYGGDPGRVVVSGASSGAHLAALVALTSDRSYEDVPAVVPPRAAVLYFPVLDPELRDFETARSRPPAPDMFAGRHAATRGSWPPPARGEALLGGRPASVFDPTPNVLELELGEVLPPFLLLHGSRDTAVGAHHSARLHERLVGRAGRSELYLIGDADHADSRFFSGRANHLVVGFLREHLDR